MSMEPERLEALESYLTTILRSRTELKAQYSKLRFLKRRAKLITGPRSQLTSQTLPTAKMATAVAPPAEIFLRR